MKGSYIEKDWLGNTLQGHERSKWSWKLKDGARKHALTNPWLQKG